VHDTDAYSVPAPVLTGADSVVVTARVAPVDVTVATTAVPVPTRMMSPTFGVFPPVYWSVVPETDETVIDDVVSHRLV
jgi:hypothetical protein